MPKFDISNSFKVMQIKVSQWPYFCVKWKKKYYVFVRLVFGCRSSPCIFDTLSQALCWIAHNIYGVQTIFHLLDDFLTVDVPDSCAGHRTNALLTLMFNRLGVPLAKHKRLGPTVCLEYLGLILDSINMQARLPSIKVHRIIEVIETLLEQSSCTKLELLQLLDHFNFASRVTLPRRSFVSYLIQLSTTVKELWHRITLNQHCQEDLHMWHKFLREWNGLSLFYESDFTTTHDLKLYTDPSLVGFAAVFGSQWFYSRWPEQLPFVSDGDLLWPFVSYIL